MKASNFYALAFVIALAACSSPQKKATSEDDKPSGVTGSFVINPDESKVKWAGNVINVYGHHGLIDITEGTLEAKDGKIVNGKVTIDMSSIVPMDSSSFKDEDGRRITDLQGHLMTGDFFLVEEYPAATFAIKSHEGNVLKGELTIRGNTNEETVELSELEITEEGIKGEGTLVFDRQKYEVKWAHFVQDYILSDDIEVKLNIVAK